MRCSAGALRNSIVYTATWSENEERFELLTVGPHVDRAFGENQPHGSAQDAPGFKHVAHDLRGQDHVARA